MNKQFLPYAFFEGKIVPTANAKVSIMTNALQYGTAVFGGIRGYYDKSNKVVSLFRINDHFDRLLKSLKIIGVNIDFTKKQLCNLTIKLVEVNMPKTDVYIRPFAYASSLNLSPNLNRDRKFDFFMYMIPLGDYLPVDKGLSVAVSSYIRVSDNAIPLRAKISGAYINSALARKEADDNGFDEAIFLNSHGHVCEGSAENIFIVKSGSLITPSESEDILEGITRRTIFRIARDLNIPIVERAINRSELYICDEAFLCGTGVQISWIAKVDKKTVGTGKKGPISQKICDEFFKAIRGKNIKYGMWNTKIKL